MPEIKGPDFITLLVGDLERSRRFYAETLGFKSSPETRPNAVAFSAQPISFAIRKRPQEAEASSLGNGGILLWFKADSAPAICDRLKLAGVTITREITPGPFGNMFTLCDPDGYQITIHDGG